MPSLLFYNANWIKLIKSNTNSHIYISHLIKKLLEFRKFQKLLDFQENYISKRLKKDIQRQYDIFEIFVLD